MAVYEVWKCKGGRMVEIVNVFDDYVVAWAWIRSQKDVGSYVLRYFNI